MGHFGLKITRDIKHHTKAGCCVRKKRKVCVSVAKDNECVSVAGGEMGGV